VLSAGIETALELLAPGGRCIVLSYHSGEDRLVKRCFARAASGDCVCPPGLPCVCGAVPTARVLTRGARLPTAAEVARNPRAASARLRAAERIAGAES
jgi:16S rRNA (cytosine1402-N4)-methyltransferase